MMIPVKMLNKIIYGKSRKIPASETTKEATKSCVALNKIELQMLIPISETKIFGRLTQKTNQAVNNAESIVAGKLYKSIVQRPNRSADSTLFRNATVIPARKSNNIIVLKINTFENPNFKPGTGSGTEMKLST